MDREFKEGISSTFLDRNIVSKKENNILLIIKNTNHINYPKCPSLSKWKMQGPIYWIPTITQHYAIRTSFPPMPFSIFHTFPPNSSSVETTSCISIIKFTLPAARYFRRRNTTGDEIILRTVYPIWSRSAKSKTP